MSSNDLILFVEWNLDVFSEPTTVVIPGSFGITNGLKIINPQN